MDSGRRPVDRSAAGQGSTRAPATGAAEGISRSPRGPKDADDDDEVNPLPPALEPETAGAATEPSDAPDRSIALARGQNSSEGQRSARAPYDPGRLSKPIPRLMAIPPRPTTLRRGRSLRVLWQGPVQSNPIAMRLS